MSGDARDGVRGYKEYLVGEMPGASNAKVRLKKGAKKLDSHQIIQFIQGQTTDDTLQNALRADLRVTYTSMSLYVRGFDYLSFCKTEEEK